MFVSSCSLDTYLLSDGVRPAPCWVLKVQFKARGSAPKVSCLPGVRSAPRGAAGELCGAQRWVCLDEEEGFSEEACGDLNERVMGALQARGLHFLCFLSWCFLRGMTSSTINSHLFERKSPPRTATWAQRARSGVPSGLQRQGSTLYWTDARQTGRGLLGEWVTSGVAAHKLSPAQGSYERPWCGPRAGGG